MLPPTPPPVSKYGAYNIEDTCDLLGCGRDTLREKTKLGRIKHDRLDDENETIVYYALEILRYWFNTTKQPKTEGELMQILDSLQNNGYEATFGCKPPAPKQKKKRQSKSSSNATL